MEYSLSGCKIEEVLESQTSSCVLVFPNGMNHLVTQVLSQLDSHACTPRIEYTLVIGLHHIGIVIEDVVDFSIIINKLHVVSLPSFFVLVK